MIGTPPPADPKLLGETYGFWAQTLVLFTAAALAWLAIRSARAIERRKAAAAVIFASRHDDRLLEAIRHIAALHDGDRKMSSFAEDINCAESKVLRYALNHYEYVSVGIAQGIYDETIFKNSSYTTMVKLYDRTKPYIDAVRENGAETYYQEFECLMVRWKAKPLETKEIRAVQKRTFTERVRDFFRG